MQLVILAGGKGTRLGLKDIPKLMVCMAGKPVLEHQIELARQYGIDEIFILEGYLANTISNYFKDGSKWGVKINHIVEPKPLGTAGALKLLEGKLKDRFLVFYGDIIMDFDIDAFRNFDLKHNGIASILVHPNTHPYDSDLVEVGKKDKVLSFLSKPHPDGMNYRNLVNAAVYILSTDILNYIENDIFNDFGKHIFPKLLKIGKDIFAYHSAEYIKDIGTKDRFPLVCEDLESGKVNRLNKKNKRPAIFLDRDGTINENMDTNPTLKDFKFLPQVVDAFKLINKSDYLAIIITNQPMIAKGFVSFTEVDNIHKKLETELGNNNAYVDAIYYCPHHPEKGFKGEIPELKINCDCRKPKIGLFLQAKKDFNIDFSKSWMIGDSETDMEAGNIAGCKTVAVEHLNGKSKLANYQCKNLKEAVKLIMEKTK